MARWIDAGRADELAPGQVKVVRAGRRQFAVCNVENSFHCIDDVCTHDGGPLDQV
jgi:nitrite reductase/ring-hydroxylating ferredoxin subunit